jgi:DNA-binding PadR family transcriptional regulator
VLATLSFDDELTGYAIHQRVAMMFRYFFGNLAHSQVYRELRQLEALGWVSSRETGSSDRAVRAYRLTEAGCNMFDTIETINRGTSNEPRWRYPGLVNQWSRRISEATQEATAELLRELDNLERLPPEKPAKRRVQRR